MIHERPNEGRTCEWLTPPEILAALGPFDLDPCCPENLPWEIATEHYTPAHDGLVKDWHGFVWLNPPYGRQTWTWTERLADHGNGIALIFARTDTAGFVRTVWRRATAVLFLHGRPHFHLPSGERAAGNSGGPLVLVAYGPEAASRLARSRLTGTFLSLLPRLLSQDKPGATA